MTFDLSRPVPLLILSDGPDQLSGLGRIGHDLARLLCTMPEFRVGYLGRAAFGRASFPWVQYSFSEKEQWGEGRIREAWEDLSQGQRGVILTVWDATRLLWFADPVGMPEDLREFLGPDRSFEKWGYFMQDSCGVIPERIPHVSGHVMGNFDRVLLASKWAYDRTYYPSIEMGKKCADTDWMPHGIDRTVFTRQDRYATRSAWEIGQDTPIVGCVMTNQARKHWPTVLEAVARMKTKAHLWIHTDKLIHYWNINALVYEYGLAGRVFMDSHSLTDREMALRYSACDATVVISGGEGFCYPVAESLSCGTPVVTGSYGAQAELTPETCVAPAWHTIDTQHNVRRAHYNAENVAVYLDEAIAKWSKTPEVEAAKVLHLDWSKIGIPWKRWFLKGLQNGRTTE